MNFTEEQNKKIRYIEKVLKNHLPTEEGLQRSIMSAMSYSVMAGGKRVRPMLMMEVFSLCGGTGRIIEPFMAALEMIHTYSLIHDDLPAMDNDDYRRGRETTHKVYGEAMGILAGDALLNYAFEVILSSCEQYAEAGSQIFRAAAILARKAGIYGMIGGQVIDIEVEGKQPDMTTLNTIYELKTAALIEAAMMIGAVLAGADDSRVKAMEQAAGYIGLAFQIQDDILDMTSTSQVLGKPVHSDEKNNKTTYAMLMGKERSQEMVCEFSEKAIQLMEGTGSTNMFLTEFIRKLIYREK